MVVTLRPATAETGVTHERVARPSMCTVQAPHWAMPQPNLVPVMCSSSRITHSSGVSGSAWTVTARPLMVSWVDMDWSWSADRNGRSEARLDEQVPAAPAKLPSAILAAAPGPGRAHASATGLQYAPIAAIILDGNAIYLFFVASGRMKRDFA